MEKAAGAGAKAGVRWELASGCVAVLAACVTVTPLHAQEASPSTERLVAQARPEVRVQVQTSALPRFDAQDAGFQAPRVDLTLRANDKGTGLAPVFGMSSLGAGSAQPLGLQPRTGIDFGLRWTQRLQSQSQIDVTAWRRLNAPDDAYSMVQMQPNPVYGARIEMNFKSEHGP